MINATSLLVSVLIGSVTAAALMNAFGLPGPALPLVLLVSIVIAAWGLRDMARGWCQPPLEVHEKALLGFALAVGMLRLGPYAWQYIAGTLVAPVTWDDNWHFQELASLVNAEHWPPRLNFQADAYFHFYYVPWMPAAAISSVLLTLTGAPMIKLGYALGALLLDLAIAWSLIVVVRHLCPAPGRMMALAALLIAGAAVDGLFAIRNFIALGQPVHSEWWQQGLLVHNSFSAFSSALIWVPHHLIAGMAMLLAVVVATRPGTLEPRTESGPWIVAGVLLAAAAFSSVFAFVGGLIALSPLLWELLSARHRRQLTILAVATVVPALPLAYIYLGADARGGFLLGHAYWGWHARTGSPAMGVSGVVLAFLMMMLEVGWLFVIGRGLDRGEPDGARLRAISIAAGLMLASTAVVAFSGSNNWALRAPIVPVVLLACYVGRGLAAASGAPKEGPRAPLLDAGIVLRAGTFALCLAAIAHINETAVLAGSSARSPAFAHETAACKAAILEANRDARARGMPEGLAACRDEHSAYHVERRYVKPTLSHMDRELMGRGFGFLSPSAPASAPPRQAGTN
jgi:hypothetical protein